MTFTSSRSAFKYFFSHKLHHIPQTPMKCQEGFEKKNGYPLKFVCVSMLCMWWVSMSLLWLKLQWREHNKPLNSALWEKKKHTCTGMPAVGGPDAAVTLTAPPLRLAQSEVRAGVARRPRRGVEREERGHAVPRRLQGPGTRERKGPRAWPRRAR